MSSFFSRRRDAPADSDVAADSASPSPSPSSVKDVSMATFMTDVIAASRSKPVIVDFWADWCGPCRQLTPLLEKVVSEFGDRICLAKVNADAEPRLAEELGVSSLPSVFAFVDGRPVDGFAGAMPEGHVRRFVSSLLGDSPADEATKELLETGRSLLSSGAFSESLRAFSRVLEVDGENREAIAGAARAHLSLGDVASATSLLEPFADDSDEGIQAVRKALSLQESSVDLPDIESLSRRVEESPKDYSARFDLASALNAAGRREEAAEELLRIVSESPKWNDEAARRKLVEFFEAWGVTDEVTSSARRRLSSLLFS